jgi:hypothetical protein
MSTRSQRQALRGQWALNEKIFIAILFLVVLQWLNSYYFSSKGIEVKYRTEKVIRCDGEKEFQLSPRAIIRSIFFVHCCEFTYYHYLFKRNSAEAVELATFDLPKQFEKPVGELTQSISKFLTRTMQLLSGTYAKKPFI